MWTVQRLVQFGAYKHTFFKPQLLSLQFRSQSFVPLDQRSENESSGGIHVEQKRHITDFLVIRLTAQSQSASMACYVACLKWMLPEHSFSHRRSRGMKLWERDCSRSVNSQLHGFSYIWVTSFLRARQIVRAGILRVA